MMSGLNVERAILTAIPVGIMAECLDRSVAYAREREQFGQKIGRFQLIQAKIAAMYSDLEASRWLMFPALEAVRTDPRSLPGECGGADVRLRGVHRNALEAIRCTVATRYIRDLPLERLARDAKLLRSAAGPCNPSTS